MYFLISTNYFLHTIFIFLNTITQLNSIKFVDFEFPNVIHEIFFYFPSLTLVIMDHFKFIRSLLNNFLSPFPIKVIKVYNLNFISGFHQATTTKSSLNHFDLLISLLNKTSHFL